MRDDTDIGGGRFPSTRRSAVLGTRSADPSERARSLDSLSAAYWKPVHTYVRARWRKSVEDAKDRRIEFLEGKLRRKDEVVPELMEEHIQLKTELGEP